MLDYMRIYQGRINMALEDSKKDLKDSQDFKLKF